MHLPSSTYPEETRFMYKRRRKKRPKNLSNTSTVASLSTYTAPFPHLTATLLLAFLLRRDGCLHRANRHFAEFRQRSTVSNKQKQKRQPINSLQADVWYQRLYLSFVTKPKIAICDVHISPGPPKKDSGQSNGQILQVTQIKYSKTRERKRNPEEQRGKGSVWWDQDSHLYIAFHDKEKC